MTVDDFVKRVGALSPRLHAIVDSHLRDYEEDVLLHVLMAGLRRWSVSTYYNLDDDAAVRDLLALVDEGMRMGDDKVRNAVAVSFVEDARPSNPRLADFFLSWPDGLKAQAARQRDTK